MMMVENAPRARATERAAAHGFSAKHLSDTLTAQVFSPGEAMEMFVDLFSTSLAQGQVAHLKMMTAADGAVERIEASVTAVADGIADLRVKMLENVSANANAGFEFAGRILNAKSTAELIELSSAHTRQQFETAAVQLKDLAFLAHKIATEMAEPIVADIPKSFRTTN
jgi:hypothetical protein